jgi:hypothetical protein
MIDPQTHDPRYRDDVDALAEELRRTHGAGALDAAISTAKQHLNSAAWKNCALWLQVVNRLNPKSRDSRYASSF